MHVTWSLASPAMLAAMLLAATLVAPGTYAQEKRLAATPRQLSLENKPWKGDFDAMLERRMIRVLVPYSRTLYFNDKGRERGITAELVRDFERYLNKKYAKQLGKRPLTVYIIPTTRDKLLPELERRPGRHRGRQPDRHRGAAEDRGLRRARRTASRCSEIVVTGPEVARRSRRSTISRARRSTCARRASYYESLVALNERCKAAGKAPVTIALVPDALEDEDMLEMLERGLVRVRRGRRLEGAACGRRCCPRSRCARTSCCAPKAYTGWAIRKDSPQLDGGDRRLLHELRQEAGRDRRTAWRSITSASSRSATTPAATEFKRFEETLALFEKYGAQYGFDPLMLAAQGYQESQLDQKAKSHVGAIGVMQIMPATGERAEGRRHPRRSSRTSTPARSTWISS